MSLQIGKLGRHLTTCKKRVKHVLLHDLFLNREIFPEKLNSIAIPYTDDLKRFQKISNVLFEATSLEGDKVFCTKISI